MRVRPATLWTWTLGALLLVLLAIVVGTWEYDEYPALRTRTDATLQDQLEGTLRQLGLGDAVREGHLAVALVDITKPRRPRLAAVNGDRMMYAASLPKIAILLGAFEQAAAGELVLDRETRNALTRMIRHSSNRDASAMMRRVGPENIARTLQSGRYRFYDPEFNGGLWVGKPYSKAPVWRRDPLHNLSHGATAIQVARFYYLLETGRLVSPEYSREMKAMLGNPAINHKFVRGLAGEAPSAEIYRKSGTWRQWHADSALVQHGRHRYIVVGLAKHPKGGAWLERLIAPLDALVRAERQAGISR